MTKPLKAGSTARIVSSELDPVSMSIGVGIYDPVTITKVEGDIVTFTYIDANSCNEMEAQCQTKFIKEVY